MKLLHRLLLITATASFIALTARAQDNVTTNKPAIRVAVVGASIAAGYGTPDPEHDSYPSQLRWMLGAGWDVRNFGVSGTTLIHSGDAPYINTKQYQQALAYKPDVLVIDLGGNDSKSFNYEAHPGDFIPDYEAMVAAFRDANPKVKIYAALPTPAFPDNYGIRDSVIASNIIPAIKQAAAETKITVIDLHRLLAPKPLFFPDRVHPNKRGAGTIAAIIYGQLRDDYPAMWPTPKEILALNSSSKGDSSSDGVKVLRDIEYANVDGHSLKLDLYIPENVPQPVPLIIDVHGGGWMAVDKHEMIAAGAVKHGFAVASIDYRLSGVAIFPAQIYDCKAAVRWLRAHAGQFGLNPDKIGAWGDSAGGHLVSLLGLTANHPELEGNEGNTNVSSRVQAVCDFYGPSDLWTTDHHLADSVADNAVPRLIGGLIEQNVEKARLASPLNYVTADACPFLIVHGDKDPIVPLEQSVALNDALQKVGVPTQLYIVKGGGHGFNDPHAYELANVFFTKYLK
ncbi:MAG: GDSL-type esterase/lipase family protein [Verrucomicrobiota bacterium]|jgi:acetyl esterase/lipase